MVKFGSGSSMASISRGKRPAASSSLCRVLAVHEIIRGHHVLVGILHETNLDNILSVNQGLARSQDGDRQSSPRPDISIFLYTNVDSLQLLYTSVFFLPIRVHCFSFSRLSVVSVRLWATWCKCLVHYLLSLRAAGPGKDFESCLLLPKLSTSLTHRQSIFKDVGDVPKPFQA